ncbi:hypothetical protein HPB52_013721 [Rhipicephalus sanguineus]|uniref:Endonuclease/exonuclease/phosphatase domain-containing protein n=1 Tax=Rhipicephalus sanguineus TaxID=34632 RepID=A0A9D4SSU1_RHISA|nr:hypothetical protein HPB52_013721 [Rhipicephalus sanguineus]
MTPMAPDVILLQEPNCTPSLAGFEAYGKFSKLGDKLLICGDFNAAHSVWGYPKNTGKGTELWDNICNMRFTLLSDPAQRTRVGNSFSRDTCPDLTMIRATGAVISSGPLDETLGSDHYIVATVLPLASSRRPEHSPDRLLQELQARYIPSGASPSTTRTHMSQICPTLWTPKSRFKRSTPC